MQCAVRSATTFDSLAKFSDALSYVALMLMKAEKANKVKKKLLDIF